MDEYLVDDNTAGRGTRGFRRGEDFSRLRNPRMVLRRHVVLGPVWFGLDNGPVRTLDLSDSMICAQKP